MSSSRLSKTQGSVSTNLSLPLLHQENNSRCWDPPGFVQLAWFGLAWCSVVQMCQTRGGQNSLFVTRCRACMKPRPKPLLLLEDSHEWGRARSKLAGKKSSKPSQCTDSYLRTTSWSKCTKPAEKDASEYSTAHAQVSALGSASFSVGLPRTSLQSKSFCSHHHRLSFPNRRHQIWNNGIRTSMNCLDGLHRNNTKGRRRNEWTFSTFCLATPVSTDTVSCVPRRWVGRLGCAAGDGNRACA